MEPDVQAFFTEQDECMNVVDQDFEDFLMQTTSPAKSFLPGKGTSTSIQSAPEDNSSILTSRSPSATGSKAHEDLTSNPQETSPLPSGSKRKGDALLMSPSAKKRKTTKGTKPSSSLKVDDLSSRASRPKQERATKPSKPTNVQLCRGDSTSSIEEITSAVFSKSAGLGSKASRPPAQKIRSEVKPRGTDGSAAVASSSGLVAAPTRAESSSYLAQEMASRVASLTHKSAQPRVHKATVRKAQTLPASHVQSSTTKTKKTPPQNALSKKAKAKAVVPEKFPPVEYAQYLLDEKKRLEDDPSKTVKPVPQFLLGMNIFYCGGESGAVSETTRKRMKLLLKYGANLQPKYHSDQVSHIVVDKWVELGVLVSKIGLKKHDQIPDRIPTVRWEWVADGIVPANNASDPNKVITLKEYWHHPAYIERFDAGSADSSSTKQKSGRSLSKAGRNHTLSFKVDRPEDDFDSDREEYDLAPGPSSASRDDDGANSAIIAEDPQVYKPSPGDPLAEFYAQATAEHYEQWSRHGEVDLTETDALDSEASDSKKVVQKATKASNWTCDKPGQKGCPNQYIIDKLAELQKLHEDKPDRDSNWKALALRRGIRALQVYPTPVKSFEEALALKRVGFKTASKIWEVISTGDLRRIHYENTDDVKVTRLFSGIYGVGTTTALKWYKAGARTLDDVRQEKFRIKLSDAQRIGLDNYDDINSRMPREEAKALFELIKPIALAIDPKFFVEIMGSYRRGKADCGDIDIMITRDPSDGKTHAGVLAKLLQKLHDVGILTDDLALPENPWDQEAIYRGLCRLPKESSRKRRIDFLTVPWKSRGAALLYYTGDDIFNRAMRLKANHAQYSLNQKGLFEKVIRNPSNRTIKLDAGVLLASETEEEIFKILGVPWQEPHERVRNFD